MTLQNNLFRSWSVLFGAVLLTLAVSDAYGQTAKSEAKPGPDVLVFTDGEKLIGHLVRSTGDKVTFKSDMAGAVTVEWKKVQELHTSQRFAVIVKKTAFRRAPSQ